MITGASCAKRTVFVIEDDRAVRRSLEFVLDLEGYAVESFSGGNDILQRTPAAICGCLVVDFKLPDCDGLTLIGRLRDRHPAVPAILITSHPRLAVEGRARSMGVVVVEKPLLGNQLVEEIQRLLDRRCGGMNHIRS